MRVSDLANRRVGVWGLRQEGMATLDCLVARVPSATLFAFDDRDLSTAERAELAKRGVRNAYSQSLSPSQIPDTVEVVIKTPGISLYCHDAVRIARAGVELTSSTRLWFGERPTAPVIAVTGSTGKSTTATLIHLLLQSAGINSCLGGNVGVPLIKLLDGVTAPEVWVLELSSYQIADLEFSPTVGVLLNLFPEHMQWHKSLDQYYRDKTNLFRGQGDCVAVLNNLDPITQQRKATILGNRAAMYFNDPAGLHVHEGWLCDGDVLLCNGKTIPAPGSHNWENACAALTALKAIGIAPERVVGFLQKFGGLPNRLQHIGRQNDVDYINDSVSKTPQSAVAALRVFEDRLVTLLLGGEENEVPYQVLVEYLAEKPIHAVVTLPENGRKIMSDVEAGTRFLGIVRHADNLEMAVEYARSITPPGGVVLLSPAAKSYHAYSGFEERGKAFTRAAGFNDEALGT